jgi:uncharacterized membrane protein YeaQ/YmgE (transglycosylase-associated protein family)
MDLGSLLLLLLIAGICGAVGQSLAGYSLGGCLVSIVVGFVGAFLGAWLARELGLPEPLAVEVGGRTFPLVWAVLGSALFALGVGLVRRASRRV